MKKAPAAVLLGILLLVGYCSLPLTTVVSIEINLQDQDGRALPGAAGTFVDGSGKVIGTIEGKPWVLEQHHLSWWTSSAYPDKGFMRPVDALNAREVLISAPGCVPLRLPIRLTREYHGLSLSPHGGGPAFNLYQFEPTVKLTCRAYER